MNEAEPRRLHLHCDDNVRNLARLTSRFTRYRVRYCVIGGLATHLYLPRRLPHDVDIIIGTRPSDGRRTQRAIADLALSAAQLDSHALLHEPDRLSAGDELQAESAWGALHIVGAHLPGTCSRDAIVQRRRWHLVDRYPIAVCSLSDLIAIKNLANHGSDGHDVAELTSRYQTRR